MQRAAISARYADMAPLAILNSSVDQGCYRQPALTIFAAANGAGLAGAERCRYRPGDRRIPAKK